MIVPPSLSQRLTCHHLYLNWRISLIPLTSIHLFSDWTLKLPLSTMASTTKATSHNCLMVTTTSAMSLMWIRNKKIGVFHSLTSPWPGMTSARKVYYSRVTWHLPLLALSLPWQTLSALLILLVIALAHFSQLWPRTILIERCGFRVTSKKNAGLNPLGHMTKSPLQIIELFEKKVLPEPYQRCVFWQLNLTRCSIHSVLSLRLSIWATMRIAYGPSQSGRLVFILCGTVSYGTIQKTIFVESNWTSYCTP